MKTLFISFFLLFTFIAKGQNNIHKVFQANTGQCKYLAMTTAINGDAFMAYHYLLNASTAYLAVQRVDTSGNLLWVKGYESSYVPVTITTTPDGGFVIALLDTNAQPQIQLLKLDQVGNIEWAKYFQADSPINTYPLCIMQDGSIFFSHGNLCLKKISSTGILIWEKQYVNSGTTDYILPSQMLYHDSSLYIGGYYSNSYSSFLIKTDTSGNIIWQKYNIGDIGASLNLFRVSGGGVILSTIQYSNNNDTRIASIAPNGAVKWALTIPPPHFPLMLEVNSNKLILCSKENNILKAIILDTLGNIVSAKSYHDSIAGNYFAASAITNKGFWIGNVNNDKVWLMKANELGITDCFMQTFTPTIQSYTLLPSNLTLSTATANTTLFDTTFTPQIITLTNFSSCGILSINSLKETSIDIVFSPNPFSESTTLSIKSKEILNNWSLLLYNSMAKKVKQITDIKENNVIIQKDNLKDGIYFYQLINTEGILASGKLLVN